jgi:2-desacetyl-2-hydroxyethyl bacteriochlorophyllide A dehydrogenase
MKAVLVTEPGRTGLTTINDPEISSEEILVRVFGCGICGTDSHILTEGLPTARYPLVPGHEAWGEVVEVGPATGPLRPGHIVAIDPSLHCGLCGECRRGRGNLCESWGSIGGTRAGAWAEFVAVPARNAYVLPEGYPTELAVIIEPVACLLRGLHLLGPEIDNTAIVVGAGTMGVLWALALRDAGLRNIAIIEHEASRREYCGRTFGFEVFAPTEAGGREADYVIDATGSKSAMEDAITHAAPGGTVMFFGVAGEDARVSISPFQLYKRELKILTSMAILHTFGNAVKFVGSHAAELMPIVTDAFALDDFESALAHLGSGGSLKVALDPRLH